MASDASVDLQARELAVKVAREMTLLRKLAWSLCHCLENRSSRAVVQWLYRVVEKEWRDYGLEVDWLWEESPPDCPSKISERGRSQLLQQLAWDLRNLIGNFHLTETGHEMKDEVDERWGKLAEALGLDLDWLWADERPADPVEVLDLPEEHD